MSGGDVAKVAIPMALTVASGGLAAPALAAAVPALGATGAGILAGAAAGGLGSAITGGDPLTGAALGGIGGGITAGGGMEGVFGGGADTAATGIGQAGTDAAAQGVISPGTETFSAATDIGTLNASFDPSAPLAANSPAGIGSVGAPEIGAYQPNAPLSFGDAAPLASTPPNSAAFATPDLTAGIGNTSSLAANVEPSSMDKMLSFAKNNPMSVIGSGIGGYMTAGGDEAPEPLAREERKINNVAPLKREQLSIDPNAFYGIGGARSGYVKANPNTVYLADGGKVRDKSEKQMYRENAMESLGRLKSIGYPAATRFPGLNESAEFVHERYLSDDKYPYDLKQYVIDEYGADSPVSRAIIQNVRSVRGYAHGGSVAPRGISSMVRGGGDGQSDTIPAMLSDGEYVIPAPVVSALGRGSNDAGAKKLDKMKKHIMEKTYKGGKPPAAGLGAMRVA